MTAQHSDSDNFATDWVPEGPEQTEAIRRHLEQILASQFFRNSHRYPNFLRYVVNETLKGRGDQLKERTLGIEVFGRQPDYDTNLDHIVRSTATEVRKRLALYYQESGNGTDFHIELPQRSYTPVFHKTPILQEEPGLAVARRNLKPEMRHLSLYAVLAGIVLFLGGAGAEYLAQPLARVRAKTADPPPVSLVDVLTSGAGHHLNAVIGDAALYTMNGRIAGNYVSLSDYQDDHFLEANAPSIGRSAQPDLRFAQAINNHLLLLVSRIFETVYPYQVSVRTPRDITVQDIQRENTLLVEGPRVNPWVQLFETRMNFRTEIRPGSRVADIRNVDPRNGEKEVYSDVPATASHPGTFYGHIAYFPANSGYAKVLIVSSPEGSYTPLCFATDPTALPDVLRLLGVKQVDQLPSFELLLKFTGTPDTIAEAKIVAFRRRQAPRQN